MNRLSKIHGQIERITFSNEENGFTIAKRKAQGEKDLVTVVGNLLGINPGEVLELLGIVDCKRLTLFLMNAQQEDTLRPADISNSRSIQAIQPSLSPDHTMVE